MLIVVNTAMAYKIVKLFLVMYLNVSRVCNEFAGS